MTDRGLPIVDGAPACPFVAFEDDRDGRALAPDHRHRCFAEPRPAPRALAHQEAYCLSSAFPVCPTFQDWARREAAAARPSASQAHLAAAEPPVSSPMPPLDREGYHATGTDTPPPIPPRQPPQRDWAAPPPWAGEAAATPPEAQGLAGSAAYRLAGPDPAEPVAAAGAAAGAAYASANAPDDLDDGPDWGQPDPSAGRDAYAAAPPQRQAPPQGRGTSQPAAGPHDHVRRQTPQEAADLFGPAWEQPHRYEAYPSLRTRVGMPGLGGVGRLGIGFLALLLAALALFFVGPMLLGIGGPDDRPGAGAATASAAAEETVAPEPTEPPAPTPKVYVVKKGDTISKIAKRNDLTIEQLLAANPQIKNPNKISIGDEITIPVPEDEDTLEEPSAEP